MPADMYICVTAFAVALSYVYTDFERFTRASNLHFLELVIGFIPLSKISSGPSRLDSRLHCEPHSALCTFLAYPISSC